jgi:capsular polysaccharide biosynthesis protein
VEIRVLRWDLLRLQMNLLTAIPGTGHEQPIGTRPSRGDNKPPLLSELKDRTRRAAKAGQKLLRVARVHANAALRAVPVLREGLHIPANRMFPVRTSAMDGVKIHVVEPEHAYERPLPHMPGESEVHYCFTAEHRGTYHGSFVAELSRGRIWGYYGGSVFTRNGQLIPALSKDIWGPRLHSAFTRSRLPRPEWLPGKTLSLLTPEASGNFHHWMVDVLPRIGFVQRAGYSLKDFDRILLKYRGLPFQKETLRRAGIDEKRIMVVDDDTHIEAETLVVPSMHMADVRVSPGDMEIVRRFFLREEPPRGSAWRRLYVGRSDAAYRRVSNANELNAVLEKYGFEEVAMSRYTVEEGARLFSEASIIVGPNGSALANLLFAPRDCRVVEFFAPKWVVCYNWMIAANLGMDYTALIGRGARPPHGTLPTDLKQDIDLDVDLFERVLREKLAHV